VYISNKLFKKLLECAKIVPAAVTMLVEQCNGPRRLCDIDDDDES